MTRTLTDDGSLTTPGSPQQLALNYFTTNFPAITNVDSDTVREFVSSVYSLAVVYYSTGGDIWRDRTGWVGTTPPCGVQGSTPWVGVTCTDSTINNLVLPVNDLIGQLPSEVRGLATLQSLELPGNSLTGFFPEAISQMSNLTSLDLSENFLSGTIPASLGGDSNLQSLSLDLNQFIGTIPPEINQMINLQRLDISGNSIDGLMPLLALPSLGKLFECPSILVDKSTNLNN